jgi:hypothetical protein
MAAQDILTAAEVKAYLGISGTDSDTIIGTFITDVSNWLEDYLGRKVKGSQAVAAEIGSGDGTEFHIPKYPPVTAITVLQYRSDPNGTWTDVVSDTDYILLDTEGSDAIELYGAVFPYGRFNLKLTYTSGYATTPARIKQVAYEMVATRFRESNDPRLGSNRLGISSTSKSNTGGGSDSWSFEDQMPKWKDMLRPYLRPRKQIQLIR